METEATVNPGVTWDLIHQCINQAAQLRGEWAGAPMPVHGIPLVVEPRYPFAGFNGFCLGGGADPRSSSDESDVRVVNSWYSVLHSATVYICEEPGNPRRFHVMLPEWGAKRLDYWVMNIGASQAWSVEAEFRALETLRGLVKRSAWESYVLTGSFFETSRRSGVQYLFRKLRPTIAIKAWRDRMHILTTLCLHPIGYYQETHAGVMVPTDDVMAHLLLMRSDEHYFWKKANHHPSWAASAGI